MRKKSVLLFIFKILKLPLTLLTLSLTAKYFGVSLDKDVWLLASASIIMLDMAFWGPLNDIFRTKFIYLKEKDSELIALDATKSLLTYIFLGSLILVAFIEIYPFLFARVIAPTYNSKELSSLCSMLRLIAPILLINQSMLIGCSILNAYDSFYVPELASAISLLLNIVLLIFLHNTMGIYALVGALYISDMVLILFLVFNIKKKNIRIFNNYSLNFSGFKIFFVFAFPLFLPYLVGQLNSMVERSLVSGLSIGAVSIIDFSRRIPDMVNNVITSVILTVLVPTLARLYVMNKKEQYEKDFIESYKLGILGIGMFIVFLCAGATYLIGFFYKSKSIPNADMLKIIQMSKLYACALLGIFSYVISGMSLLATGKNKLNALSGTMTQVLTIILNLLFVKRFGFYIFPLSMFIAHFSGAAFMFKFFPYSKKLIIYTTLRYYIFLIVLAIVTYWLGTIITTRFNNIRNLTGIILIGSIQLILFIPLSYIFKISEFEMIFQKLRLKWLIKKDS
ncbi:MAG: lipid II flippase MurJ [Arachidicoccus sp.]|nr:lipid II flippase MurJ [Arachidicoccus sp.]